MVIFNHESKKMFLTCREQENVSNLPWSYREAGGEAGELAKRRSSIMSTSHSCLAEATLGRQDQKRALTQVKEERNHG